VAAKQLLESPTIACQVGGEQIGVAKAIDGKAAHGRTVSSAAAGGTSPCEVSGRGANSDLRDVSSALAGGLAQGGDPHQQI